jgi:ATP-dependent Clp protease protease subunit
MNVIRKEPTAISFKAQASNDILSLDILDVIGADFFGQGITSAMVKDALKSESGSSIVVNINSPGGDLFEGVSIYNILKASGKPVTVNVIGLAASAASLIAMAGDTITMHAGTQMMIHEALAVTAGHAVDMRKMADVLDSVTASAADIYTAKTNLSKDKVLALMKDETWMTPSDALSNGFATSIGKSPAVKNSFDLSLFKNAPAECKEHGIEVDDAKNAAGIRIDMLRKRLEIAKRK